MALFNSGRHSFNKKYERISDAYRIANQYRRRRRIHRSVIGGYDGDGAEIVLPSRREKYGRRSFNIWKKIWSVFPLKYIVRLFARFSGSLRITDETRMSVLLGYIPSKLFLGLCVITCGLYPYIWMWDNAYAFNKLGEHRINEESLKRLAVLGLITQLFVPFSAGAWMVWKATGSALASEVFKTAVFVFLPLYFFIVFPMRCFNYFCVRWALRGAVIEWDSEGVMVNRSITSWLKLFLLGSIYIQYHINRLMGLGMPGFADPSEIESDASLFEIIDDYVKVGNRDRVVVSWTKDDFEPENDDEFEDDYEEYDG